MIQSFKLLSVLFLISYSSLFSQNLLDLNSNDAKVFFTYVSEETKGEISNVTAKISIDSSKVLNSIIEGKLDISNLTTSNGIRDKHLKSKTYFHIKEYPEIEFKSQEIIFNKNSNDTIAPITCKGTLFMKGFKKTVIFDLYYSEDSVKLKSKIYADDFGVAIKPGRENSLVEVEIIIER